jgi:hypothetical protein
LYVTQVGDALFITANLIPIASTGAADDDTVEAKPFVKDGIVEPYEKDISKYL